MQKSKNPIRQIVQWLVENIAWDIGKPLLVAGVTTAIQFLFSKNVLPMFEWYISIPVIFTFIYGFLQIFADIYNQLSKKRLLGLIEVRNEGIKLTYSGKDITDEIDIISWKYEYNEWIKKSRNEIAKISPTEAEKFRYIRTYKLTSGRYKTKTSSINGQYNVLLEKVAMFDQFIERFEGNG